MGSCLMSFDRKLDDYNTSPSPREIKGIVVQIRPIGGPAGP